MSELDIRNAAAGDHDAIWEIMEYVIAQGDTLVFAPGAPRASMLDFWAGNGRHTYVADINGKVLGTYFIKANQPDLGSHIANAGYMTHPEARGQGIGYQMGLHSLQEARQLGFHAMQFNIVIKSNEGAVRLWQKLGFDIIGEIPDAFQHQKLGLTNAYIMYQKL